MTLVETSDTSPQFGDLGMAVPTEISREQWAELGQYLGLATRASMWWVGDWVRAGETRWGETYAEAERLTGLKYQSLANAVLVSARFEFSRRRENLSWSHHLEVAALGADIADRVLDRAEAEQWTRDQLRAHVKELAVAALAAADQPDDDDEPDDTKAPAPSPKPSRFAITVTVDELEDTDEVKALLWRLKEHIDEWLTDKGIAGKARVS